MITEENFVKLKIGEYYFKVAQHMAKKAEVGGVSRIFKDQKERLERQKTDSLVGQLGTLAGVKLFTGGIEKYIEARYMQNKFPRQGDGGEDITGSNVDFKVSLKRYSDKSPLDYHLLVRPRERHSNQIYIHGLILPWKEESFPTEVIFTGWATDKDLPEDTIKEGPLEGAYGIDVKHLNPIPPITWKWFN
tara:strand:+ start:5876 stop:6445 length:570 start_codon:yes stop_codon:yes gene_type:complete